MDAQQNINAGIWDGVEDIDTQVLIHLLIDWLRLLQVDVLHHRIQRPQKKN